MMETVFVSLELALSAQANNLVAECRFAGSAESTDLVLGRHIAIALDFSTLRSMASNPSSYGQMLSAMLFGPAPMRRAWDFATEHAESRHIQLQIRLRLDDTCRDLHGVRWEWLADPRTGLPLSQSGMISVSCLPDTHDGRHAREERCYQRSVVVPPILRVGGRDQPQQLRGSSYTGSNQRAAHGGTTARTRT